MSKRKKKKQRALKKQNCGERSGTRNKLKNKTEKKGARGKEGVI